VRKAKGMRSMWAYRGQDILFGWISFEHSVHNTQSNAHKKEKDKERGGGRELFLGCRERAQLPPPWLS